MVRPNIINYLRENKDKFSQKMLKEKLIKADYPKDQIEEEILPILSELPRETNFWDFKSIKISTNFGEKLFRFSGWLVCPIIIGISRFFISPGFSRIFFSYF